MRDLQLVGISEDRRSVVLADPATGEQFRVAADESMRAALRGDRLRLGQQETQMDSALRPRDIQARIRAGASPEEVAEVANVPVERIMGYAVPVLAEREHIVGRARSASVRRKHTEGPTRLLGDTVTAQVLALGGQPESAQWDSWRRDDGRWVVTVALADEAETAHYVFDPAGRYAVADDAAARRLIADEPPVEDPSTMAVATALQSPTTTVPVDPPDWSPGDAPAGEAEPEGTADEQPAADEHDEEPAAPGVTRLRRRRGLHQLPEPVPLPLEETSRPVGDEADTGLPAAVTPEPRRRRDRRRTSVPSWDEIMFGGQKGE
jgi:hypothetical protein